MLDSSIIKSYLFSMKTSPFPLKTALRDGLHRILGDVLYERLMMWYKLGYWPHLMHPRSFNEKISYTKLFNTPANAVILADKWAVREHIAARIGPRYLNKVYFVSDNPDLIPFESLPEKFVIRITHSSNSTILVHHKSTENLEELRQRCRAKLKEPFGTFTNEPWYTRIRPQVMIEELLEDPRYGIPQDYKFYVFNGRVEIVLVQTERFRNDSARYYTRDWQPLDFTRGYPLSPVLPPPANLGDMISLAETLSDNLDFVRVDFYSINHDSEIRFGEITFAPSAGWGPFSPRSADFDLGSLWKMTDRKV